MSESVNISCYEVECFISGAWVSDSMRPWCNLNMESSPPRDDISLPSSQWNWASNWKIEKETGGTDKDGWEYA